MIKVTVRLNMARGVMDRVRFRGLVREMKAEIDAFMKFRTPENSKT